MGDYGNKRVLVVDDHPGMRASLRITLSNFGVTQTDMAPSAADAVHKVRQRHYDIIISDYNLGEGRDGQQLLEELRQGRLIGLSTVFIMVTAERMYEKVISAVELVPDDYLIKPFSAEVLRTRLEQVLRKKTALGEIFANIELGRLVEALAGCEKLIGEKSRYIIDVIRIKAELLVALGEFERAREVYEQVVKMRAVPWAQLGLARTLHLQEMHGDAESILMTVIDGVPEYLAAYDLLAQVQEAEGKRAEAQDTLSRAVSVSPNTLPRQQALGELALNNGDLDTAVRSLERVLTRGANSVYLRPEDFANMAKVYMGQGKVERALATAREISRAFKHEPRAQFASAVTESLLHAQAGDEVASRKALEIAEEIRRKFALNLGEQAMLDLAQAMIANNRAEEGGRLVEEVVRNNHESESLLARATQIYDRLGRGEEGRALIEKSRQEVVRLNNEGVGRAQQGDLEGAAKLLGEAAQQLPNNVLIVLNAAHALLALIRREGFDEARMSQTARLLAQARSRDDKHPKLLKLTAMAREAAHKHGVNLQ
jgi:DNA-binding response OmpR family regulator/Tfp pilus assembly protein PilF